MTAMRKIIGALLAAAVVSLGVSATTPARADTIAQPLHAAGPATSAPPHIGLAAAIPVAATNCKTVFEVLTYNSGHLQDDYGYLYTNDSGPVLNLCQVATASSGWYFWIIQSTNLCMTYNATYSEIDFITCRNLAAQYWYLFTASGGWLAWENDYGLTNTLATDEGNGNAEYVLPIGDGTRQWYWFVPYTI